MITPPLVEKLGEVLTHHRGATEVRVKLQGTRKTTVLRLERRRVKADPALFGHLKELLGPACLADRSFADAAGKTFRGAGTGGDCPLPT